VALYLLTLVELGIGADLRILQPAIIQQQHVLATSTADESTRIAAQATNTAIVEQSPNFLFASLAQRTPLLALNDAQDYKNWRSSTPTNQYCAFQHGAYTAQIDQQVNSAGNFYTFCADADQQTANLHNFAYQADLTIQRGDEGGLIFRDSSTTKSLPQLFYMYTVNEAGTYGLSVAEAQVQVLWYQPTNVIKKGVGQTNILTVIAYNNWIYLFINSHYLAGIYDNSSSAGTIGVVAVGGSNATIAAFTHVRVWTL
jgi:hypothetical protein